MNRVEFVCITIFAQADQKKLNYLPIYRLPNYIITST